MQFLNFRINLKFRNLFLISFFYLSHQAFPQLQLIDSLESEAKLIDPKKGADENFISRYQKTIAQADTFYSQKKFIEAAELYKRIYFLYKENEQTIYNSACSYALSADAENAVGSLQLMFDDLKSGGSYTNLKQINEDKDFDPVRKNAEWIRFIERTKKGLRDKDNFYSWGIYFGIGAFLLIYNLFLFLSTKDKTYLYYSILTLMMIQFEAYRTDEFGGFVRRYISEMNYLKLFKQPFPALISLISISYLLFSKNFLRIKELTPKIHTICNILIWINVSIVIFFVFSDNANIRMLNDNLCFLMFIFIFIASIYIWLKIKYKPARIYVLATTFLTLSTLNLLLKLVDMGVDFKVGVFRADNIGLICFFSLLSFALGDRINLLTKEKAEAQEKALEVLEQKVKERTFELEEKSKIIEEKNHDIMASIHYAQRIQKAHLPTEKYLRKIFTK